MRLPSARFLRFLAVGGFNTAMGYGLQLAAQRVLDYRWAYAVSYVVGIGVSYLLNSLIVFRQPLSWRRLLMFPAVYAVQFVVGLALLWLLVDVFGMARELAPLVVIVATVPFTYLASRFVLANRTP